MHGVSASSLLNMISVTLVKYERLVNKFIIIIDLLINPLWTYFNENLCIYIYICLQGKRRFWRIFLNDCFLYFEIFLFFEICDQGLN